MTSEVIWLIVISFFFAKGFEKTGLGERLANIFVAAMGKSTLGLAYGLSIAELLLSPALPSTTARAGGWGAVTFIQLCKCWLLDQHCLWSFRGSVRIQELSSLLHHLTP